MPAKDQSNKLQYFLLALMMAGSMIFYIASASAVFDGIVNHSGRARPPFDFSDDPRWAVKLLPEALAAGIRPPDLILKIDGVPFTGMANLIGQVYSAHAGQPLSVTYRTPAGRTHTVHISLLPRIPRSPKTSRLVGTIIVLGIFPAFCLLLGYAVVLAKPRDWNAWFFLGVMNVVPVFFGLWGYYPGWLTPFTIFWQIFAMRAMFISLVFLGVYFPVRSRADRRRPWVKWLLIVPQILMIPLAILLAYGLLYHVRMIRSYLSAAFPLHIAANIFAVASVLVFLGAVVKKLFTVAAADARRRLGVVAAGSLLGLTPVLVTLLVSTFSRSSFYEIAPAWMVLTLVLLFALFPLSLAYTVLVQRALDVRILLRQGTRYALARGTLWGIEAVVLVYLGYGLFHLGHEAGHRLVRVLVPAIFVVVVLLLLRMAQPLSRWIDRRFFREAYSAEQVLSELSEEARGFTEIEPLIKRVFERLDQTLHIERMAVLLRREGAFEMSYAHGLPQDLRISLPESSAIVGMLSRGAAPLRIQRDQPDARLSRTQEAAAWSELGAELLLPLPGRAKLIGLMSLGQKLSEEPYSSADRRLLQSVALQTGLAIENSELIHTLADAAAQRESMNREIEIAQEVQARLFPQSYPTIEGVSLAGVCRTAQRIGGDYFDFLPLENGRLGVAIADVSGKGISAALLMASIRAALRGLTFGGTRDPRQIMRRMNQMLYDSSTSNRFTTFFYGEYDPATRRLVYVNAGHNAPVLLRAQRHPGADISASPEIQAPRAIERLQIGGLVMGIFAEVDYEHGEAELKSGDALIAFTDGLSEAMNAGNEEWGEERLLEAAQAAAHLSPKEISIRMLEAADRFTAGAPQNDDLTVVVIKLD